MKAAIAVKLPRVFIPAALDSNFEATVGVHMDSMSLRCQQLEYQPTLRFVGGDEPDPTFDDPVIRKRVGEVIAKAMERK